MQGATAVGAGVELYEQASDKYESAKVAEKRARDLGQLFLGGSEESSKKKRRVNAPNPFHPDHMGHLRAIRHSSRLFRRRRRRANLAPVPMLVDPPAGHPLPNNVPALRARAPRHNMPRYGKRRRPRRRRGRRGRGSRTRYKRRRKVARRSSRALRLYPGGFPLTRKIKLRLQTQFTMTTKALSWVFTTIHPANLYDPLGSGALKFYRTGETGAGNHIEAITTNVAVAGAVPSLPQPMGYDQWLSAARFNEYNVLGTKISIIPIQGSIGEAGHRFYGGFSRLTDHDQGYGQTFTAGYTNIDSTEVSDWINAKVVRKPQVITSVKQLNAPSALFQAFYSQKKYARRLKRKGITGINDFAGNYAGAPTVNPSFQFCLADVGQSTTATRISFMIVMDFTVALHRLEIAGESVVA